VSASRLLARSVAYTIDTECGSYIAAVTSAATSAGRSRRASPRSNAIVATAIAIACYTSRWSGFSHVIKQARGRIRASGALSGRSAMKLGDDARCVAPHRA
jgi:hypothetical protein